MPKSFGLGNKLLFWHKNVRSHYLLSPSLSTNRCKEQEKTYSSLDFIKTSICSHWILSSVYEVVFKELVFLRLYVSPGPVSIHANIKEI